MKLAQVCYFHSHKFIWHF